MADGKIQTPFSEITSPGGLKCQEFGGRRGFEERQVSMTLRYAHVHDKEVEAAAERVGKTISNICGSSGS